MSNKVKIILSSIGVVVSMTVLGISAVLTENAVLSPIPAILLTTTSAILAVVAVFFAVKIDYETGVFECRKCGHAFKPSLKAYIWGSHTLTTRHLKCPKCEEKSWCRRKMV